MFFRIKKYFLTILFLVFSLFYSMFAQKKHQDFLEVEVNNLLKEDAMKHASLGISVINLQTNQLVFGYDQELSLIPASTLKIITTGAALGILGSDYRYETLLQYDGVLDTIHGILYGNVYIKGSGDPSLGSEYFSDKMDTLSITDKWAILIKQKKINKITGAVIADASVFEDETIPSNWIWGDMGNYYGAGAFGLSYSDNKYAVYFNSGKNNGDATEVINVVPSIPGLKINNKVISTGTDDNAYIFGAPYTYQREVIGSIPCNKKDFVIYGSIPDPSWYCAYSLTESLKKINVEVLGSPSTIRELGNNKMDSKRKILHTHLSPTLDKIIYYTNLKSNNLFTEHLLKTIAYKKNGIGTGSAGIDQIKKYWSEKGIDLKGFYMTDGCGLSRANTITARQQVEILKVISQEKYFNYFYNSLPIAGKTGSLATMCIGAFAENNLRAKSGYISRARAYAGYVKNKKNENIAFSVIVNNYDCSASEMRLRLEKLLILIAESN